MLKAEVLKFLYAMTAALFKAIVTVPGMEIMLNLMLKAEVLKFLYAMIAALPSQTDTPRFERGRSCSTTERKALKKGVATYVGAGMMTC